MSALIVEKAPGINSLENDRVRLIPMFSYRDILSSVCWHIYSLCQMIVTARGLVLAVLMPLNFTNANDIVGVCIWSVRISLTAAQLNLRRILSIS